MFVDFFSRCLNAEYSSKGVTVQVHYQINQNNHNDFTSTSQCATSQPTGENGKYENLSLHKILLGKRFILSVEQFQVWKTKETLFFYE